jgi:hypothetical protein
LARGEVSLKALRDPAQPQRSLLLTELAGWAASLRDA